MTSIIASILIFILWAVVIGHFYDKNKVFAVIWFFVGLPVTIWVVVSIFSSLGLRISTGTNSCEVDYSRAGVSSVYCDP